MLSNAAIITDPVPVLPGSHVIEPDDSGGGAGQFTATANNVSYNGGALIQNVQIEPIFIMDATTGKEDSASFQASLDAYFTAITSDSFIPSQLSQYSVPANFDKLGNPAYTIGAGGKGTDDDNVLLTPTQTFQDSPAISDSQIQTLILDQIAAPNTAAITANTLYFVFTPPGDVVTTNGGGNSVNFFLGYHTAVWTGTQWAYYAVIPDESAPPNANLSGYGLTALQGEEQVSSHEMSEGITDPVPVTGWANTAKGGSGEVADLADNESYTLDGYQVQYLWSNQIVGPGHAPGTAGQPNLFINQLSPPAVDAFTSGPVGTFTDPIIVNRPSSFTAYAYTYNGSKFSNFWTTSISGGANGVYVVNATPSPALADGQVGFYDTQTGMYLFVYEGSNVPFGTVSGDPLAVRYQPFTVNSAAPLTYNADNGIMSANGGLAHSFRLVQNRANFDLYDNGQLVFVQPTLETTTINIGADPDSVDSSLKLDFSGGTFTNAVTFDGGDGAGLHTLTGPNTANIWTINAANGGAMDNVTFSAVQNLVGGTGNDVFNFTSTGSLSGDLHGGGGVNSLNYAAVSTKIATAVNLHTAKATLIGGMFRNIQSLVGNGARDATLIGTDAATTWVVSAINGGMAGSFGFTNVPNLVGGSGANIFTIANGMGMTGSINGGSGTHNTLDYSAWTTAVVINLATGHATGIMGGIRDFNLVNGGTGNDTLTGGTGTDIIRGNGVKDTITGGSGNDILIGVSGNDKITVPLAGGRSILIAGQGASTLTGGNAGDIIIGGSTSYDDYSASNNAALLAILTEWTRSDTYSNRIATIRSGITEAAFNSTTVQNVAGDVLNGRASYNGTTQLDGDWFWAAAINEIHSTKEKGEQVN